MMGVGAHFSICSFIFLAILSYIYFLKPKINNAETNIYGKLLILTLIGLFLEVATCIWYVCGVSLDNILYQYASKLTSAYYMVWTSLFAKYVLNICNVKKEIIKIANIIYIIYFVVIIFLPISYITNDNTIVPTGPSIFLTYFACIVNTVMDIILCIKNRDKISGKKLTPVYSLLLIGTICIVVTVLFPETFLIGFQFVLIIFIMYFTIENPDVKMAKELAYQKQVADASTGKTLELLDDMSNDLKSSLYKLESFGNKKIDKNNIDELYDEMIEFQKESIKLSEEISGVLDLATIKGTTEIKETKYETYDMIDKLKQLIVADNEKAINMKVNISGDMPAVLYGDDSNVVKIVLYFYNYISSIIRDDKLLLDISSMQVGRFSRLKFKFATSDLSINNHIREDKDTNRLEFNNSNDINYQIIKNLLDKFNGKITIIEKESTTLIELSIDQRLLTEYDILSKREENKNIDIKYGNYSNKRLLIVDNNNVKIKELKTLLKPYNVDVQSANSSSQMSEMLNKNVTYDMILIDDIIPDFKISDYSNEIVKSKDSIINYIKMTAKYSIITIIMLNPNTSHMEKEYLDYGFTDYILKPINKENLDKILKKYFDKK